jgi:adenylyltransferase/sulfurtransferase
MARIPSPNTLHAAGSGPAQADPAEAGVDAPSAAALTAEEMERYSRHFPLREVGVEGQLKLKNARVLVVGAGGLGAPMALYLSAAGIGTLGVVDFDAVERSNLQRQVIHTTADIGRGKLESAAASIAALNPNVRVVQHELALASENALGILQGYDVVADGSDNFPTRYLVNDACVLLGKPNVYGSVSGFEGQASVFATPDAPCYRCLYPEPPPPGLVPSCAEGGVLGILPGIIGLIQATEVIKLILGVGQSLKGRLLLYDALAMRFREVKLGKSPDCPVCGPQRSITQLIDYHQFCGVPRAPAAATAVGEIDARALKARLDSGEEFQLIDVREPHEYQICHLPQARLIPLGELPARLHEIDRSRPIVAYCKMGGRSARAAEFLRQNGFSGVLNLSGGILAWSEKVDPAVAKY